MNKIAPFLCFLVALNACQQTTETAQNLIVDQMAKHRIDSTLQSLIADSTVVGASALIFEKGKEVYFNAFGYADREAGVSMARNTIVTIYSMTKPITGTTLMTLYEKDKFQLSDPLSNYAPEFKDMQVLTGLDESGAFELGPADRAISVADITRHTAGFSRRADLGLDKVSAEADLLDMETTLTDMVAKLSKIPLGYQPGQRWEYAFL